jgi:hypothetical protein
MNPVMEKVKDEFEQEADGDKGDDIVKPSDGPKTKEWTVEYDVGNRFDQR